MKSNCFFLAILFLIFIQSCTSNDDLLQINIGDNFIKSQSGIVLTDSFSLKMSTILIDSVSTSGTGQLLIGKYTDKLLGKITSTGYFQINMTEDDDMNEDAILDSVTLVLNYSGLSYGDTTLPQIFHVHRVIEDIEPADEDEDNYLYNTSSFKYYETPLGSLSFYPEPKSGEEIEIRLDDNLGLHIMELIKSGADEVSSSDNFVDFFKGFAIVPDINNTCIVSFEGVDSLVNMKLYTHYSGQEKEFDNFNFQMLNTSTCFNNIKADKAGTVLENFNNTKTQIPSSKTDGMTFMQAGIGIVTRIDFPSIERLLEFDINKILYKVEIVLKPYPNVYETNELPEYIQLYETNQTNKLITEVTSTSNESVYAEPHINEINPEETYYTIDITNFISEELSDGYVDPDHGIILVFPSEKFSGSLDRIAFNASNDISSRRPKLNIYYIYYN